MGCNRRFEPTAQQPAQTAYSRATFRFSRMTFHGVKTCPTSNLVKTFPKTFTRPARVHLSLS